MSTKFFQFVQNLGFWANPQKIISIQAKNRHLKVIIESVDSISRDGPGLPYM